MEDTNFNTLYRIDMDGHLKLQVYYKADCFSEIDIGDIKDILKENKEAEEHMKAQQAEYAELFKESKQLKERVSMLETLDAENQAIIKDLKARIDYAEGMILSCYGNERPLTMDELNRVYYKLKDGV